MNRTLEDILTYIDNTGIYVLDATDACVLLTAYKLQKARADALAKEVEDLKRAALVDAETIRNLTERSTQDLAQINELLQLVPCDDCNGKGFYKIDGVTYTCEVCTPDPEDD